MKASKERRVSRFDQYLFVQLLLMFGLFSLVLVGVLWMTSAAGLFDQLISGGQSALVFLEFSALTLPTLARTVMPMSVFAVTLYVTNRLSRESELTVMLATGATPMRLARGVFAFGIATALMMAVLTHVLRPVSIRQLDQREAEVSIYAAAVLSAGRFHHVKGGITFYIGHIDQDGTLNDVFLSDRRDPRTHITYTGSRGFLVRRGEATKLILVNGMAQHLNVASNRLGITSFTDLIYDITQVLARETNRIPDVRGSPTSELIWNRDVVIMNYGWSRGAIVQELHERSGWALICLAVAMMGFSTLMLGGYSRFGLLPQVILACTLLIVLEVLRGMAGPIIEQTPALWPLGYVPGLIGLILAYLFLWLSGRPIGMLLHLRPRLAATA